MRKFAVIDTKSKDRIIFCSKSARHPSDLGAMGHGI